MKQLSEILLEKLKIDKNTKILSDKENDNHIFMIVWSDKGRDCINTFNTREDAQTFISGLKNPQIYLDGYVVPEPPKKYLWPLMELVQKKEFDKLEDFRKKHRIKRFYE